MMKILPVIIFILAFTSCNKTLERYQPADPVILNTTTIGNFLNTDPNYSFFRVAARVGGYSAIFSDSSATTTYTVFALNNAAFIASGIPDTNVLKAALSPATLNSILGYLIIPGREFLFTDFPTTFPNIQLPTLLGNGQNLAPTLPIPFRLTNFPSRRGALAWLNATPITAFDMRFRNGVVHTLAGLVTPPSLVLAQMIFGDPQYSLFAALITRADQSVPSANLTAALSNGGASLTVFTPSNQAIKNFISASTGGIVPPNAADNDPRYIGFINGSLPAQSAQGIVLTHILTSGVRAFSVNFSSTATKYLTLLNGGIPNHPGISVQSVFTTNGLSVTTINVIGNGNGGVASVSTPSTNFDRLAINGIIHVIDRLLLP